MEQRIYLFDSPKLITEMLDGMCDGCITDMCTEILEVPRPDCGEYKVDRDHRHSFYRMMKEYHMMNDEHRKSMNDDELRNFRRKEYSKCYVFIVKAEDNVDLSTLDDVAWMNGGILAQKPASFFYEKADKVVALAPDYSVIDHIFGNKDDYSSVYDDKFGR